MLTRSRSFLLPWLLLCAVLVVTVVPGSRSAHALAFNVKDYGAVGDGVTQDITAIRATITAAPEGSTIFFPAGTYRINGFIPTNAKSNLTFQGAGMFVSTVTTTVAGLALLQPQGGFAINLTIQDLGFDPQGASAAITLLGGYNKGHTRIRRCRFWRTTPGVDLTGMSDVLIEDSLFHSPGTGVGAGISAHNGGSSLQIVRNRFLYLFDALLLNTIPDNTPISTVTIAHNVFDGGWYTQVASVSGSGGTVTYATTGLTDTSKTFTGIDQYSTVRAMPTLRTGTATVSGLQLTDAAATFTSGDVRAGQLVRMGASFGIVASVADTHVLTVEEWLSDADRQPLPPAASGAYTLYDVVIGKIASASGTTLTLYERWHNLNGTTVLPTAGTRYEFANKKPNYPYHATPDVTNVTVANNTFTRGWSDQISVHASDHRIVGNQVRDGQDMGITVEFGSGNTVEGNTIDHQGACNIVVENSNDNTIRNNQASDAYWIQTGTDYAANICVQNNSSRNLVKGNILRRVTSVNNQHAVVVYQVTALGGDSVANILDGNTSMSMLSIPFFDFGAYTPGTICVNNTATANPLTDGVTASACP
jgi:parallel beta-helix repeat protein